MTSDKPDWTASFPELHDIVTCWFPDSTDMNAPGLKLRPGLVTGIVSNSSTRERRVRVSYGTSKLKYHTRGRIDLLIQKAAHLDRFNLDEATRFDLDHFANLPWDRRFFDCWEGHNTPVLSRLDDNYIGKLRARIAARKPRSPAQPER